MSKGYTAEDILDEIRRKKAHKVEESGGYTSAQQPIEYNSPEPGYAPAAPLKDPVYQTVQYQPPHPKQGQDFFEQRQSGAPEPPREERPPTYSPARHGSEPMTTRTIKIDDTLPQYFGTASQGWLNQKKNRQPQPASRPAQSQPVYRPPQPAQQAPAYQPVQPSQPAQRAVQPPQQVQPAQQAPAYQQPAQRAVQPPQPAQQPVQPPQPMQRNGFNVRPVEPVTPMPQVQPTPAPVMPASQPVRPDRAPAREGGFNVQRPADEDFYSELAKNQERPDNTPLTASSNPELYKEYSQKRHSKVEQFMQQVREPTEQGMPALSKKPKAPPVVLPTAPEAAGVSAAPVRPTKIKFADEKSNSEIAAGLVSGNAYEEDEPDDYMEPSQAKAVQKDLSGVRFGLVMRLALTAALFLASLALALSPVLGFTLPAPFEYSSDNVIYPIVHLAIICASALVCNVTVGGGLISLLKLKASNDSYAASAVLGSVILGVSFVLSPDKMASGGENLYFPLAVLALVFNTVGKLVMMDRISDNFEELIKDGRRCALLPVHNRELARELTGQSDEVPRFCCSAEAKFFTGFLDLSYRDDATAGVTRVLAPVACVGSLLMAGLSFFFTGSVHASIVGLAAALSVASPLAATIAGSLPVARACKALNKDGTVMAGGYTAETFAEADSVLLDIDEIFPEGSITLHGIKTFAQGRIDEAILDAASVICSTRSTLGSIFINVVQGDRSLLRPADTIVYEDGMGLSAWVNSKRVLIGNRELMMNHGVDIPSRDYEEKYVGGGRDILYLANTGELTAMFVLSYHADPEVKKSLDVFAARGVKLVINCTDPNITLEKLSELFGYPKGQLKILSSKYQPQCSELTRERDKAPAAAVYNGKLAQLSDILSASGSIRQACFLSMLLEIVGVVLGFIMITFFLFTGSMGSLGLLPLLGYQLFWVAAVTVVAMLRKPI